MLQQSKKKKLKIVATGCGLTLAEPLINTKRMKGNDGCEGVGGTSLLPSPQPGRYCTVRASSGGLVGLQVVRRLNEGHTDCNKSAARLTDGSRLLRELPATTLPIDPQEGRIPIAVMDGDRDRCRRVALRF